MIGDIKIVLPEEFVCSLEIISTAIDISVFSTLYPLCFRSTEGVMFLNLRGWLDEGIEVDV
jgi:hypothetical protein